MSRFQYLLKYRGGHKPSRPRLHGADKGIAQILDKYEVPLSEFS